MKINRGDRNILGKRAKQAREAVGYSLKEAAELLGFNNYQTLSAIEKGDRRANANDVSAMARLYSRNLDYFFEPEFPLDPKPLWRKTANKDIGKIQRTFLSFVENYSEMEKLLNLRRRWKDIQKNYDKTDFLLRGFDLADRLGTEICGALHLGSRPALNLINILENDLRIKILHLPLPSGISGACIVDDNLGVGVLINAKEAQWRRNYDLAHELFHIVTWNVFTNEEVGDGIVRTKPEQYADAFASSLLLPEKPLGNALEEIAINHRIRIVDIIELAKEFGVSTAAILWRLANLHVLNRTTVEKILADSEFKKTDRSSRLKLYHKGTPNKFPSRYISIACRCLLEGKISRGVFAEYLEIDRAEVDSFINEQGFREKNYEEIASA